MKPEATTPIAITLTAQDIGRMTAQRFTTEQFFQDLIERFKTAGAPVEWSPRGLKFKYGELFKMKTSVRGPGFFDYVWLPPNYAAGVKQAMKQMQAWQN